MVGTVTGHFEQNIFPLVTQLVGHASVVLCHASTDLPQLVEAGAVQSKHEVFQRRVQYDVRQSCVPVAELSPVADRRRKTNCGVWNARL